NSRRVTAFSGATGSEHWSPGTARHPAFTSAFALTVTTCPRSTTWVASPTRCCCRRARCADSRLCPFGAIVLRRAGTAATNRHNRLLAESARPPDLPADVVAERGNQQRTHHEGVEQHPESDDERDLGEEQDGQNAERRERRSEHKPGRGDHTAGGRQPAQDPLSRPVLLRLLTHPCHQEDVVVDTESHQEHEPEHGHRRV